MSRVGDWCFENSGWAVLIMLGVFLALIVWIVVADTDGADRACTQSCEALSARMVSRNRYGCICDDGKRRFVLGESDNHTPVITVPVVH